jgi:hypothetical protein
VLPKDDFLAAPSFIFAVISCKVMPPALRSDIDPGDLLDPYVNVN